MTLQFAGMGGASLRSFVPIRYPPNSSSGVRLKADRIVTVRDHEVEADEAGEIPTWVLTVLERFDVLKDLPHNWDTYGGRPLTPRHLNAALTFLGAVMTDDAELPDVVPLADGGVQLEWRLPEVDLDFISDEENPRPLLLLTTEETEKRAATDGVALVRDLLAALKPD